MSFPERAESLRAKAHLNGVKLPVVVGLTSLVLVVLIVAGQALIGSLTSGGFSIEKSTTSPSSAQLQLEQQSEPKADLIVVHVAGAVLNPGMQELKSGSRVGDAIDAAGGCAEDALPDALNLARVLKDGEQVLVPTSQEGKQDIPLAPADPPSRAPSGKVDINTASAEALDALPGIGPSTAEKIVDDRKLNGPFNSVEDLKRVSGIGDKKFAALVDSICVG